MSRPVHLGLDVGGTACRWVACAADGAVLGRGQVSGATGHIFNPAEKTRLGEALINVNDALARADLTAVSVSAGITGYGASVAEPVKVLVQEVFGVGPDAIALLDDIVLAYLAHFAPGQGHLISAGTGSIGVHVSVSGEIVRVGGRGILIDDGGSGSWIALRALDQIYRSLDHQGSFKQVEQLAGRIFAVIGGAEWHDVRQFVYGGDRGRIGALAVAVARAAEDGDQAALSILRQAGAELAQLATALRWRAGELPIRFVGGVFALHPAIFEEITAVLAGAEVSRGASDAALAAAQLQIGERRAWTDILDAGAAAPG